MNRNTNPSNYDTTGRFTESWTSSNTNFTLTSVSFSRPSRTSRAVAWLMEHRPGIYLRAIRIGSWQFWLWYWINRTTGFCDCGSPRGNADCRAAWEAERREAFPNELA